MTTTRRPATMDTTTAVPDTGGQEQTVEQEVVVADSPRVRYIKTLKRALEINGEALDLYRQGAPAAPPVPQSAPRPAGTQPASTQPASTRRRAS